MTDRNLIAYIDRKLAGESQPEQDQIPLDGDDPRYRSALAAELQALAADGDAEEPEDEDEDFEWSLEDFSLGASLAMGFGPTDEEVAEARPLEGTDEESGSTEATPADVDAWWAQLSTESQDAIRAGTPENAQANYLEWATQRSDGDDRPTVDDDGPMPRTGSEFVDFAWRHAEAIQAEWDMTVPEYLAAIAGANAAEFAKLARVSGLEPDSKPTYFQLDGASQTQLLRNDLARSFAKMQREGRHIE